MSREIDRLIAELHKRGDKLEAQALRAVQRMYGELNLAELIEALRAATELDSPLARLGYADELLGIFADVASGLATPPPILAQNVRQAVEDGIWSTAEMFAASQVVTSAFTVPPTLQLEWMDRAEQRFLKFWGHEPERFRKEVADVLRDGLGRGQGIDQMARRLRERVQVSRSRATLIARNEIGTASSYAAKESQKEAGVTHYIWRSASDKRVRPEHRARNGKTFAWSDPPPDGHPGEPINCRCVALAVVGEHRSVGADSAPPYLDFDDPNRPNPPHTEFLLPEGMYPVEDGTDAIYNELAKKYPMPEGKAPPVVRLAFSNQKLYDISDELGVPHRQVQNTAAYFDPSSNQLVIGPNICEALKSKDVGEAFIAARYLTHEYFHGLRSDKKRVLPFEEAGAELFANRTMLELTGLDGSVKALDLYAPYVQGVKLIAERIGEKDVLAWLLRSRREKNMESWAIRHLGHGGFKDDQIGAILESPKSASEWLELIQKILSKR